jgi:hypothetical protein
MANWVLLRNFAILSRRNQIVRKKKTKKTKTFYNWATTGIPVIKSYIIIRLNCFELFSILSLFSEKRRLRHIRNVSRFQTRKIALIMETRNRSGTG